MHARNRTWPLGSDPAERCRQRTMPVEGGDGSTLSLDFTTGVLDPRLTFTRGGNATFINSSGLVEIAGANMFRNSVLVVGGGLNTPPTSWTNAVAGATYTLANNEVKIETNAGGTARAYMFANYFGSSASGLRYTIQFVVTARTGSAYSLAELVGLPSNPPVSGTEQWSVNGTSRSSSYTAWGSGDTITYSAVTTGGSSFFPSIGCGIFNALGSTTSVTITRPQMNLGSTASAYFANSSTSAGYHDVPRFDYDPTTIGSPRGLLIEGSANNLSLDSENFSAWSTANTSLSSESGDTNPDGITVPTRVSDDSTNAEHNRTRSPSLTTATTYTKSVWFKNPATNGRRYGGLQLFAGGGTDAGGVVAVWDFDTGQTVTALTYGYGGKPTPSVSCVPYKSGWYRVSISMTVTGTLTSLNHRIVLSNGIATSYANSGTALGLLVWGAQLEAGSGASSYIPTGASQGSRSADKMSMTDITTMQWNQAAGTFFLHMDVAAETNTSGFQTMMGMYTAAPVRVVRFPINNSSGSNPRIGCNTWSSAPANIVDSNITRPAAPTAFKYAAALSNTGQALNHVVNNGSVTTVTATGTLQTPTRLLWHQDPSAVDSEYFPIHIRSMKYWPTNLPDATLKAITT